MKTMIAVFVLLLVGVRSPEMLQGEREARADLAAGKLILRTYGLASQSGYPAAVLQRYGIRVQSVAGCVVDAKIVGTTAGYNNVMKAEIERRFGREALDALLAPRDAPPRKD